MELELFSIQLFLFLLLLFAYLYFHFHTTSPKNPTNKKPGVFKSYPIIGSLLHFIINRHRFLDWTTDILASSPTHSAVFRRPGNIHGIITANPLNVEHMLKTNFQNYPKGERFIFLLQDFLGRGIFNSDGELWKVQRKTASYEFNTKSLRNFVLENVKFEIQSRLIPILISACGNGRAIDLQDVLERFAFDNVCKLAFNVDPGCLAGDGTSGANEFMKAFEDSATLSSGRFMYVFPLLIKIKKFLNLGSEKKLREAIVVVHRFADEIIRSRIEAKLENGEEDLLSRFMGDDENSAEFLRDIVISFILAGRDTTSSALSWFFWLISSRPHVQETILKELEMIRKRNGKSIGDIYSFDDLRDMHYLHAAISEAMRLYPPVPVDTKKCRDNDILPDGTFVGKDWFISYHTYAMGRIESIWGKNCNEFLPERWLEEDGTYRPESPFRYPVFHAGPRMCLGKDMAYIQMKSIAASVIERFEIDVHDGDTCPQPLLSITLRMKGGLLVNVRKRIVDISC